MYNDLMIDIESLSTEPNAAIVTIGACAFSFTEDKTIGETLYLNINPRTSQQAGLHLDAGTLMFWMGQSKEAQQGLISKSAFSLKEALEKLTDFCIRTRANDPRNQLNVWANDPTFDCIILGQSYKAIGQQAPWAYWETRSQRTMIDLGKRLFNLNHKRDFPRTGTHHNAMDDAIYQARLVRHIFDMLTPE